MMRTVRATGVPQYWNWIALFVHGTIAEYGDPTTMLANRGQYYHMVSKMQAIQTGPDGLPRLSPAYVPSHPEKPDHKWLCSVCSSGARVETPRTPYTF
jgi:hypothetical protein